MPRQRRSAPARTQSRSAHTAAAAPPAPAVHRPQAPPQQQAGTQQGPGLFGQMASTAAGVAVGSSIGHTIGAGLSSIFGGSSQAPAEPVQQSQQASYEQQPRACDADARNFTKCLDDNGGNMQICDWYLQQLKACQEASKYY